MPAIIVNDYTWRQSPEFIIVSARVVGHPKKIDLFVIDNYVKASYPPFILELFLWGSIDDEASECTIGDETAVFTLKKKEIGVEWPCLMMEDLDKDKKRAQRSRALEIARVLGEKRAKARSDAIKHTRGFFVTVTDSVHDRSEGIQRVSRRFKLSPAPRGSFRTVG